MELCETQVPTIPALKFALRWYYYNRDYFEWTRSIIGPSRVWVHRRSAFPVGSGMLRVLGTADPTPSPHSGGQPRDAGELQTCSSGQWFVLKQMLSRCSYPPILTPPLLFGRGYCWQSSPVVPLGEWEGPGAAVWGVRMQPCGVLGCRRGLGGGTWGYGARYFVSIHGLSEFSHLYGSVLTFPSADGGLGVCSEAAQARTARVGRNPWV